MSRASTSVPFVAREEQLAVLDAGLGRATGGRASTVLVSGDAGVGKSRLVDALAERARAAGALVLVGHCIDLGGVGLPYLPFAEVLAAVHDVAADDPQVATALTARPVVEGLAGAAEVAGAGEEVGRLQLFDAVSGLLADLAATLPAVVLVLEDLHWADQSTRELLRFLVSRAGAARLLIVGTYRSDDLHRRHPLRGLLAELLRHPAVERLDVDPFTEAELRRFAAAVSGDDVAEARVHSVLRRSEGNAYFAEELLDADDDRGLPDTLADVLTARVERLAPYTQHLVRLASVAGRRVSEPLLRAVDALEPSVDRPGDAASPAVDDALRDAVTHRVLEPDDGDRYAFRHALLAEAVYGDLLPGERARLHLSYATAIREATSPLGSAAELAHHAMAGHDLPGALAASLAAADEAGRRVAPAETLRHLETVLQLWQAVPAAAALAGTGLVEVAMRAADAADHSGELARSVALARVAVDEAARSGDDVAEARARRGLAHHLLSVDAPGFLEESTRALQLLTGENGTGGADLPTVEPTPDLLLTAGVHARSTLVADQDDAARAWARWAVDGAVRLRMPAVEADALTTLAVLESEAGPRMELLDRAREKALEAGDLTAELRSYYNLAANTFYRGNMTKSLVRSGEGQRRADATGTTWSTWGIELRVLEVVGRYVTGDWDGSERAAALVGDTPPDLVAARLTSASLYARVGRGDATAPAAAESLRPAWRLDGQIALVSGGTLADALTWAGRPEEGVAVAQEVLDFLGRTWDDFFLGGIWLSALALAALADLAASSRGDVDQLRQRADRLLAHAGETARRGRPRGGVMGPEGRAWLARAEAEHSRVGGQGDVDLWRAAVAGFADWYPYEEARGRRRLAEALLARGERSAAAEEISAAVGLADRLGSAPLSDGLHELARRGRLGVAGTAGAASELLTAREAEVLALVAEGLTNRAAGQRLFISDKTVSVHLSNVMAKLGASSRTEAVSLAHRRGLLPAGDPDVT